MSTDQRARAIELFNSLDEMARAFDSYEYGLPSHDVEVREPYIVFIATALADERRRVLMEVGDECSMRAYAIGINEPLHTNHMQQFLEWIRAQAHAGQEGG